MLMHVKWSRNGGIIRFVSLLLAVMLLLAASGNEARQAQADIRITVTPDSLAPNENAVVAIELDPVLAKTVSSMKIDARALGLGKDVLVDPQLLAQTIAVKTDIEPGPKTLNLVLSDTENNRRTIPFEVNVEREDRSADAFIWDEAVIYFLLTDRFADGDPDNNDPNGEGYDPALPETYHGGDFQGIIDHLDYLDALGINMIWMTPIVDNIDHNARHGKEGPQYGYHGYWAKNFEVIDEHLGDLETLHRLIDAAAERGIRIMVDVVLNHAGYGMKEDETATFRNTPTAEERAVFAGMLRLEPSDHSITGELAGLPDFRTEDEAVRDQLIAWQTAWIEKSRTPAGNQIAGFRVDTVKHVDTTTWKAFKNEITRIDPSFKLLGEWFGATVDNDGGSLNGGGMDALLDFGFKEMAQQYVRGEVERGERRLNHRHEKISNTNIMAPFLSSHDEDGFLITRALGDIGLQKTAVTLQLTAKGIPVIYYGEEIGLSGKTAGDMDKGEFSENRGDFRFDLAEGNGLLEHYRTLLAIRRAYPSVFARGERKTLWADDDRGVAAFSLTYGGDTVMVAINTTNERQMIELPADANMSVAKELYYGEDTVIDDGRLEIVLPSRSEGGTLVFALSGGTGGGTTAPSPPPEAAPSSGVDWTLPLMAIGVMLVIVIYSLIRHRPKK